MNCCIHPEKEIAGVCVYCGKLFCQECLVEINGKFYCKSDVTNLLNETKQQTAATTTIDNPNVIHTIQPSHTHAAPIIINNSNNNSNVNNNGYNPYMSKPKSKGVAIVLCLLLGWLGIHRFYTGKAGTGILYMFTFGLWGIGILIDLILIITGSFRDKSGMPLK